MPGLCIKCGCPLLNGGAPSRKYEHVTLRIQLQDKDGEPESMTDMEVAICSDCELTPEDFPEVLKAHNDYFKMYGPMRLNGEIIGVMGRKNRVQIQLDMQGGRCPGCHEEIGDKYITTGGLVMHEMCNLPKPRPVKQRAIAPDKVILRE
jgi:hypothetical protein